MVDTIYTHTRTEQDDMPGVLRLQNTTTRQVYALRLDGRAQRLSPGAYRTVQFRDVHHAVLRGCFTVRRSLCGRREAVTVVPIVRVSTIAPFYPENPNWLVVQAAPPRGDDPFVSLSTQTPIPDTFDQVSAYLATLCQDALLSSGFSNLVYYPLRNPPLCLAEPSPFLPQIDLAVILLSPSNEILGAADVLWDRDVPDTYAVCLDRATLTANRDVRFFVWREARWVDPELWNAPVPPEDVLTHPLDPQLSFMLPFPSGCCKTALAVAMMRLVDANVLQLTTVLTYDDAHCPPPPTNSTAAWSLAYLLTEMVERSSSFAGQVLLQWLFKNDYLASTNQWFRELGLQTIVLQPLDPACGLGEEEGKMTAGALDVCKLLMVIFGVRGTLWNDIRADDVLSPSSQAFLQQRLQNQAYAEALNPLAVCGSPYHEQGFPTTVPDQYINQLGYLVVYSPLDDCSFNFGYDMRPCLQEATMAFAHKTGLAEFSGCDHGVVRRLDEQGNRLVVALHTSAGCLFQSPDLAAEQPTACATLQLCYANAFSKVAQALEVLVGSV